MQCRAYPARTLLRRRAPKISIRPVTSVRAVSTNRCAQAFARGLRGGIFTASMPALARTASNEAVNCPARFRTRNRKSAARLLADVAVVRAEPGLLARWHPTRWYPGWWRGWPGCPAALRAIRSARSAARQRAWALAGDAAPGADGG